ncbi:MAG: hypothetical protein NDI68_02675 [Arenimonas sp.]|nr:hypothetical protein [Arenimonas sp.]
MNARLRPLLPVLAPLLLGAVAYLLLGDGPHTDAGREVEAVAWSLPEDAPVDAAAAREVWEKRAPWGRAAAAATAATGAPAPQPLPVGVIVAGGQWQALFFMPGGNVVRLAKGEALPTGGEVKAISPTVVAWTDAAGEAHRRELLVDADPRPAAVPVATPATGADARRERARQRAESRNPLRRPDNAPGTETRNPLRRPDAGAAPARNPLRRDTSAGPSATLAPPATTTTGTTTTTTTTNTAPSTTRPTSTERPSGSRRP